MAKKLVAKFLANNISEEELVILKNWLEDPRNREYFKAMVKANQNLDLAYRPINVEKAYGIIQEWTSTNDSPRLFPYRKFLKYAAAAIILVGTSIGIYHQNSPSTTPIPEPTFSADPQITLSLEDGSLKVIEENDHVTIKNEEGEKVAEQEYNKLKYTSESDETKELVYNVLTVPYGKRFNLELSDGTFVYLNAGTKLKYPIAFTDPGSREVYLDGEALFEVKENQFHPFIVHTEKMSVRVLGTKFNVSSYQNENNTSTVLVDGSVGVYKPSEPFDTEKSAVISPSQQAMIASDEFLVREVNVEKHIAWIKGALYFVNDPFGNIIKEMERHYNIKIETYTPELNEIRYTGTFESETIEEVLNTFKRNTDFQYRKQNNKIIILPSL